VTWLIHTWHNSCTWARRRLIHISERLIHISVHKRMTHWLVDSLTSWIICMRGWHIHSFTSESDSFGDIHIREHKRMSYWLVDSLTHSHKRMTHLLIHIRGWLVRWHSYKSMTYSHKRTCENDSLTYCRICIRGWHIYSFTSENNSSSDLHI